MSWARDRAVEAAPIPTGPDGVDRKRCTRCGRVKPLAAYYFNPRRRIYYPACRTCRRIACAERNRGPARRAWMAEYLARPEVVAARHAAAEVRYLDPAWRADRDAASQTVRGRILARRRQARCRLRRATDPGRVAGLEALIAAYDRELARMDRAMETP